ncbi:MAG: beta-ketoacyl synthase N-terminal-like domain-containing protein [Jatrophihabitantaceae bacterium]
MSDADEDGHHIAVIGMAARLPGAPDIESFWENLVLGRESVLRLEDDELLAAGVLPEQLADADYVPVSAQVADVDSFDADFFGLKLRDAAASDPQTTMFLEVAHSALENAGYDPTTMDATIGVMTGVGPGLPMPTHSNYLATTVSYRLNLTGPSLSVLTACSSSLVALHLACQSLRAGDCDAVIVGGSSVEFPIGHGYQWTPGTILSRSGHCRPFDAAADGTVFGSSAAAVLLKPLAEARRDGDRIRAVILGSSVNNDGARRVNFSAPSVSGQASMVMEAMTLAEVDPADVDYVEAHGTGTLLGDPIEVTALTQAYQALSDSPLPPGSCGIGSVKGNVGHLGPVAGIAGLLKMVLALEREQLPPTINLDSINPHLELGPFEPVRTLQAWPRDPLRPRRAGVTSLGIGGTNVHVVLGEAPEPEPAPVPELPRLLVWSGRNETACDEVARRLADWLAVADEVGFGDAVATLQHGRTAHRVRRAVLACTATQARRAVTGVAQADTAGLVAGSRGLPEVGPRSFRQLSQRIPTLRAEFDALLNDCGEPGSHARKAWDEADEWAPLLSVAASAALGRVWSGAGIDLTEVADPVSLPGVMRCARGQASVLDAAAMLPDAPLEPATPSLEPGTPSLEPTASDPWMAHLSAVATRWLAGHYIDWSFVGCPPPLRRAELPVYPYARQRRIDPLAVLEPPALAPTCRAASVWSPIWRDATVDGVTAPALPYRSALVLLPDRGDDARTAVLALSQLGLDVVRFDCAEQFAEHGSHFAGRPDDRRHVGAALDAVRSRHQQPVLVVHALGLAEAQSAAECRAVDAVRVTSSLTDGKAVGRQRLLLTRDAADVSGSDRLSPSSARLAAEALADPTGWAWVDLGAEARPDLLRAAIDLAMRPGGTAAAGAGAAALRGLRRWIPDQAPLPTERALPSPRPGSVYVVIDAGGRFAVRFAEAVADAGLSVRLLVVTAADAARKELLSAEDACARLKVVAWSGASSELSAVLTEALGQLPAAGLLMIEEGDQDVRQTVEAVAAALPGHPVGIAAAVRLGDREPSAAETLAWSASLPLDRIKAERALCVSAVVEPAVGRLVLELLATPTSGVVVVRP